jgi:hypothetical protein
MAPAPLSAVAALLLAVLTDAEPWRVHAAVAIAVSLAVVALVYLVLVLRAG